MRGLNINTNLSLGGKLDNSTKNFNTYPIYRNSLIKVLAVFRYVHRGMYHRTVYVILS